MNAEALSFANIRGRFAQNLRTNLCVCVCVRFAAVEYTVFLCACVYVFLCAFASVRAVSLCESGRLSSCMSACLCACRTVRKLEIMKYLLMQV